MKKILLGVVILSRIASGEIASWYAEGFDGKTTASGYIYNSSIAKLGEGLINVNIEVVDTSKTFRYKHGNPVFKGEDYDL